MNKLTALYLLMMVLLSTCIQADNVNSAFIYEGYLTDSSGSANGMFDFRFSLYESQTGEDQLAQTIDVNDIFVTMGSFDIPLDYGFDVFNGQDRWIASEVKGPGDERFTRLNPRQKIMPTPYSLYSLRPWITAENGDLHYNRGKVGLGTEIPQTQLHIAGSVTIEDGTQGPGKVLTSDASGTASWQTTSPAIPTGVIVMWSGSIASIPDGWALCDGANGTPDLTDRFIVGAGNSYTPAETGGTTSHTHEAGTYSAAAHTHTYSGTTSQGGNAESCASGSPQIPSKSTHSHTYSGTTDASGGSSIAGTSAQANNLPPYYALALIMKLAD